jgi:DNA-binding NarL/FixJ family response regulator
LKFNFSSYALQPLERYFKPESMSIFVIDDHPLMREAVVMLIRRLSSKATVTELDRLAAVMPAVQQHGVPELICLDLKLPDTHGVSGVRELKLQLPNVPARRPLGCTGRGV